MIRTENYKITLNDGKSQYQASLTSEWEDRFCIKHNLIGLDPRFAEIGELVEYAVLEGGLTEDVIYLTNDGPTWIDTFEGDDKDILLKVSVKSKAII